jgi:hypothetical protein
MDKSGSEPQRHHYVPVFYLKRWTASDGRLYEYSKPFSAVKVKRKHPSATAYVTGLYTIPTLAPEHAQVVEKRFMQVIDSEAAKVLAIMIGDPNRSASTLLDSEQHKIWFATFVWSLLCRTPEALQDLDRLGQISDPDVAKLEPIRKWYGYLRGPKDPETFDEYKARQRSLPKVPGARLLPSTLRNFAMISHIATMSGTLVSVTGPKHSVLTSDRPVLVSNILEHPQAFLLFPLSPRHIFLRRTTVPSLVILSRWPETK